MEKLNIPRENKFQIFFCDFDEAQYCWDWCWVAVCEVEGWEKAGYVKRNFFVVLIFECGDPGGEFSYFFFAVVFLRDDKCGEFYVAGGDGGLDEIFYHLQVAVDKVVVEAWGEGFEVDVHGVDVG